MYPAPPLVVLAPRVGRHPPCHPVDVDIAGKETSQAEYLAAAAGELGAAPLVEVDAPNSANLARRDLVLRLPVVVVVAFEIAAAELDAALPAGGHQLVGVRESRGEGLFGTDGGHVVPNGVQDDLAIGDDRQDRQHDVDVLLAQHLVVVGIARHAEPSSEDVEILRVGVRAGDDDASGVEVVGAGVLGSLPCRIRWRRRGIPCRSWDCPPGRTVYVSGAKSASGQGDIYPSYEQLIVRGASEETVLDECQYHFLRGVC